MAPETSWPLGAATAKLVPPTSIAARWSVYFAMCDAGGRRDISVLVTSAALGLCDSTLRGYVEDGGKRAYDGDVRAFGQHVINYLLSDPRIATEKRATMTQVIAAGNAAYELCRETLLHEGAVKAAEGFSAPQSAPSSSSSSISSTIGGGTSDGWAPSPPTSPQS